MSEPIIAYKGFDKDMKCRDFQFAEGETYHEDKAELCNSGFHACTMPLDVLDYCESEKIQMNPLYACGWKRVGCIGCPIAGKKHRTVEFAKYPKYQKAYIMAFDRMLNERRKRGKTEGGTRWETGVDVFHWWMEDGVLPGQMSLFEEETT